MSDAERARIEVFIDTCQLPPEPPTSFGATKAAFDFDDTRTQAAVVGADIVAFPEGVSSKLREDILNAALLAQLVAKKRVPSPASVDDWIKWYESYFDTLTNIGFVLQEKGLTSYEVESDTFEAHEAIVEIATVLFANAPGALAVVTKTLIALKNASENTPWITIFNRESQSAKTARFQVSVATEENGSVFVSMISFGLEATSRVTQVLFVRFQSNEVKLHNYSGKASVNKHMLGLARQKMGEKLAAFTNEFIAGLEL